MKEYFIWCVLFVFLAGCSDSDKPTPEPLPVPPEKEEPDTKVLLREKDSLALVNLWNTSVWEKDKPDWDFSAGMTTWIGVTVENGRVVGLDFSWGQLTELSDGIGRFSVLRDLDISGNEALTVLTDSIWTLSGLSRLDISSTGLETISGQVASCRSLAFLKMEEWKGKEFPESVLACDFIDSLIVSPLTGWDGVMIPDNIGNMTGLKYLSLSNMTAADFVFPASLGELSQLKNLILENIGVELLPECIGELKNLEELQLMFLNVPEIPEWIDGLNRLKRLSCVACGLEEFPAAERLVNLEELDLSGNYIPELPPEIGQLTRLTRLSLEASGVASISDEIGNLISLRELNLSANYLTGLPETMEALIALELLDLTDNFDLNWEIPASMKARVNTGDLIIKTGEAEEDPGIK